jgi:hypothetical protein
MFAKKNIIRTFTITLAFITILLIISTAEARGRDGGSRSSSNDQRSQGSAAPVQQSAPSAQSSQRENRTAPEPARTERTSRPQTVDRPEQSNTQSFSTNNGGNSRSARAERNIEQPTERRNFSTNSSSNFVPQVRREAISQPMTQFAQPRNEQQQAAPGAAPSVSSGSSERRVRIAPPVARSVEVAQSGVRSQESGVSIKQETKRAQIAAPIAQSAQRVASNRSAQVAQTTAATKLTSDARAARTEARRQIVTPLSQSVTIAASGDRSQKSDVGRQRTENRTVAAPKQTATTAARLSNDNPQRLASENPIKMAPANSTSLKPSTSQRLAPSNTEKLALDRTQQREKIVRGTAGREVSTPSAGKLMNVERAVSVTDSDRARRPAHDGATVIKNNKTVVNNYGGHDDRGNYYPGRRDDHDGGWWNKGGGHSNDNGHHNDNDHHNYGGHHSNFFVSLGFYGGYCGYGWEAGYYEPAFCTSVAYGPVWPSYYRSIYYSCGPQYAVSYVYPSYHRRYVFMSVGGYWPCYPYARYYWYDCHPWNWYGAEPVAYQVDGGDTNNYYTYNYYGSDNASSSVSSTGPLTPGTVVNGVEVPDYDALRSAAGKQVTIPPQAAEQPAPSQPAPPTESDKLFDAGVTAFGEGNYPAAIETFQRAVRLEPNDVILPFAYAQALFANNDYEQAAAVLQTALNEMAPAKPEVFFPRGLYKDDALLTAQIKNLERAVMMNPTNSGLQLLYGYQLLGIGKADDAKVPLGVAKRDARTAGPASALLSLIDRVKAESQKKN